MYLQKYHQLFVPILSSVTYLSSSSNPTIITNIPDNKNNFNNVEKQNLIISFPKKLNHITFQGKYIHGVKQIKLFDKKNIEPNRITLMFNIWARKPYLRDLYNSNNQEILEDLIDNIKEELDSKNIILDQEIIKSINNNLINNNIKNYINIFDSLFKNSNKYIYFIH